MNVRNCRKCGKMFNYIQGPPICQNCKAALEKKFEEVKAYIRENKSAKINEIAENCGVEPRQIETWIREERLVFASDSPVKIFCETCGTPIFTGRYCEKCKKNQANTFSSAGRPTDGGAPAGGGDKRPGSGNKMHTFRE